MSVSRAVQAVPLPLDKIVVSHNPRKPLKKLQDMGIEPLSFVHEFALSPDAEKRAHFCTMIEENQPEIRDMAGTIADLPALDSDMPADADAPEFTVDVESKKMQIQPIIVRDFRSQVDGGGYEIRYGLAAGERRYIACAYIQAKTGKKQPVMAIVKKLTVQEAYWIGVEENLQREDMDEVEKGSIYNQWAVENGQADTPAPWTEVARHFKRPYHEVRGRAALSTLDPARLALYRAGRINLTDAINEALGESADRTKPSRKGTRLVPLSIKEIQALFDATPRSNVERLKALAEVMKMTLQEAQAQCDERSLAEDETEAREAVGERRHRRTA